MYKSILIAAVMVVWPCIAAAEPDTFPQASLLVEQGDFEGAKALYLPEARAGNAEAQYLLGELYRTGRLGLTGLPGTASNWLKKAATKDYLPARTRYGQHLAHWKRKKKQKKVRRYLTSAADAGDANAQFFSALYYLRELYKPLNTAFSSDAKALYYLRLAAENGVLEAQMLLAGMLLDGRRFDIDAREGARWLEMAARRGVVAAQRRTAQLYAAGTGVPQDLDVAHEWYRRAAEKGDRKAMEALVEHYREGNGTAQSDVQAAAWEDRLRFVPEPPVLRAAPRRPLPRDWQDYGPGFVALEFSVTDSGSVEDARIIFADGAGPYNERSLEAISRFRYEPATVDGRPVRIDRVRYCMTWLDSVAKGAYRLGSDSRPTANIQFEGGRASNQALDLPQDAAALTGLCFSPDPLRASADTVFPLWVEQSGPR